MASYKIEVRPGAWRELRKISQPARRRIEAAIVALADDPRPAGYKAVVGRPGHLCLRVGDYRIIYLPRDAEL
ncbi:type II toxin-antitoxin system RelE family toxin, partial [Candidatus Protofrankia californiensis]|uniref:type II toxin-antitoxin system RelE family toxin n=1 Tax=Candidatus Protofrankia californiensis TaxID=1839754 RepID=UPI0010415683